MKKSILILFVLSIVIMINSCGKYEEGPKFSIKSKAARVAATWKLDAILVNDEEQEIGDMQYYTTILEKDGTGKQKNVEYTTQIGSVDQLFPAAEYEIEWQFDPNNERIKFLVKYEPTSEWGEYLTILKLKEKEMWLSFEDTIHYHYVKTTEE